MHTIYMDHPTRNGCAITKEYTGNTLLNRYPFNKSVKVTAISYCPYEPVSPYKIRYDSTGKQEIYYDDTKESPVVGLHVKKGVLDSSTLIESKILSSSEVGKLADRLHNISYKHKGPHNQLGYKCIKIYRNAFLFVNKEGKIFDHLEVCLECGEFRSGSGKISIGDLCDEKYDHIKKFLLTMGITYGTLVR